VFVSSSWFDCRVYIWRNDRIAILRVCVSDVFGKGSVAYRVLYVQNGVDDT
jgi:hypothetical protein